MAAIPQGSLVLVTGANGYIASHIVHELLQKGYKVRGTARSEAKGQWLLERFNEEFGAGSVELVVVEDMASKDAFDQAVKGVSGVIHVASDLSFGPDPNKVITATLNGINNTLTSAASEPSVKRFVYTSSGTSALTPKPNTEITIDENTWNEEAIKAAWADPPYEDDRKWAVYGASKTQAEQALWQFVKEKRPQFVANSVLPNANFGPLLSPENQSPSTNGWVTDLYLNGGKGKNTIDGTPPQYYVDVRDSAKLHVAALIDADIQNERIFAFAEPYSRNQLVAIFQKLRPDRKHLGTIEDNSKDLTIVKPKARAEQILKKHFGQDGFLSLEESVRANIARLD